MWQFPYTFNTNPMYVYNFQDMYDKWNLISSKMLLQINFYSRDKCILTAVPFCTGFMKLATNFVIQIKEDNITECINECFIDSSTSVLYKST
jgi:hypothetical protein